MKRHGSHLDLAREATAPTPLALGRVKARLRQSLREDEAPTQMLSALPTPSSASERRVRDRVRASWLAHAGRAGLRGAVPAAAAAGLAVLLFSWFRAPEPAPNSAGPVAASDPASAAPGDAPDLVAPTPPESPLNPEPVEPRAPIRGREAGGVEAAVARVEADRRDRASRPRPAASTPPRGTSGPDESTSARARAPRTGRVEALRTFGQARAEGATRVLANLQGQLADCLDRAGVDDALEISLAIEVDGQPRAVNIEGEEPAATRFRECAEPHLMQARFDVADGLRAGPREQVTGGVIRFRLRGDR